MASAHRGGRKPIVGKKRGDSNRIRSLPQREGQTWRGRGKGRKREGSTRALCLGEKRREGQGDGGTGIFLRKKGGKRKSAPPMLRVTIKRKKLPQRNKMESRLSPQSQQRKGRGRGSSSPRGGGKGGRAIVEIGFAPARSKGKGKRKLS